MDIQVSASGKSPIYRQIVEQINDQIVSGKLKPGDKIPSLRALSVELGVNPNTVAKAYRDLQLMKAIHSRRGEGNFMSENSSSQPAPGMKSGVPRPAPHADRSAAAGRFAVLAISSEGHMYEAMHRHLVLQLQSKGIVPVTSHADRDPRTLKKGLDEVMHLRPASIILDGGQDDGIVEYLESRASSFGSAVFIIQKPPRISGKFQSCSVVSDFWLCGYRATKHLIGLGHRKIMLMMLKKEPIERYRLTSKCKYEEGYRAALKEAGLQDYEQHFYDEYDIEPSKAAFNRFLRVSSKNLPTAIVSTEDFRITTKLECFRKAGIRIPEDISIIGCYNTPWSTATEIQLSSMYIGEDKIAKKVAEIMAGEDMANETMIVPELVERSSCMKPNNISGKRRT